MSKCDSKSANPAYLKMLENQDQNEEPFSCTQCASKFTNPADLRINENQDQHKKPSAALNATLNPRIC